MKNKLSILSLITILVATLIIAVSVVAQPSGDQPPQPPQEAITACKGKQQGATCQFTTSQGKVTGTCTQINNQLTCAPAGGPPQR